MRFVIFGVGAIGGTIAARLASSGQSVVGVTRGAQLAAINANGLRLERPDGDETARFAVYGTPSEVGIEKNDVILLCMKTQDTAAALEQLRAADVTDQPIVCVQNAVENERLALRVFENVYGICVMLPAVYLEPGVIRSYYMPKPGILDIGRYPRGTDAAANTIAAALETAGFGSIADPEIMKQKYSKLLMNLGNAVQATLGVAARQGKYYEAVRAEGEAVLRAAGIEWGNADMNSARRSNAASVMPIKGQPHPGGSSWQSLERGTGTIETDYLNGEIVLLGRQFGVATPVNAYFMTLAAEMARKKQSAGSIDPAVVARELPL